MKLTAKQVEALRGTGKHQKLSDGGGLYLHVSKGGTKSWVYNYQLRGRRRELGLGGFPHISLSRARKARDDVRDLVKAGIDPKDAKDEARRAQEAAAEAKRAQTQRDGMTFEKVADDYIGSKEAGWRNPKHRQQWRNTLRDYAHPVIGHLPVHAIETQHILEILNADRLWLTKTETAKRVQGRIENILDYAKTMKLREGDNPARWRGHLDHILSKPSKVATVAHQRALPYADAPALTARLHKTDTPAARALLLTLLCATRTSETLQAEWSELDLDAKLWVIPGKRMKAGKEHRIPLTDAAVELLRQQEALRINHWVFPGQRLGRPLSYMAMTNVLKRIGWLDRTTVHGLRSTFRDWVAERTGYADRLAEVALAHQLSDKVQAAYNRSDMMEKRREMMSAWAQFLESKPGKVVQLPTGNTTS
jgi:integrase